MKFCTQCGGPLEEGAALCPHCGIALSPLAATPAAAYSGVPAGEPSAFGPPASFDDDATGSYGAPPPADAYSAPAGFGAPGTNGGYEDPTGMSAPPSPPPPPVSSSTPHEVLPSPAEVHVVTPPPGADSSSHFQKAEDPGTDTRPEIREIIMRELGSRYHFKREIGAGGMSIVYEMEDSVLQTPVAVKVLYPELSINPEVANRFRNEAVITAKLTGNPHIIKVYDYGFKGNLHYIVTQFLNGDSLRDQMKTRFMRNQKYSWEEAAGIMIKVAKALQSVHGKEVVHRDIKPGNIIFTDGSPVLIDFGIAKIPTAEQGREWVVHTQAGMSLGTPHYISPEEAQGQGSTSKSDIYSLGVVFYEMVTGRVPFDGESAQQIMIDHVTKEPDNPNIYNSNLPSHVGQIVLKLLRKDPVQRLDATQLIDQLERTMGISHGSSGDMNAIEADGGGPKSRGGGSGTGGETIMTKKVFKTKKQATKGESSPLLPVLIGITVIGLGYLGYSEFAPKGGPAATVEKPDEAPVDNTAAEMDKLYDASINALKDEKYRTALAGFDKVRSWDPSWRQIDQYYNATKFFLEGRKQYRAGINRASFQTASQYFDRAIKAFPGKWPKAEEYKTACQLFEGAIGAEDNAKDNYNLSQNARKPEQKTEKLNLAANDYWKAQGNFEKVTQSLPEEAGAYLARIDILIKYLSLARFDLADGDKEANALRELRNALDQGIVGLSEDPGNQLKIYDWAIEIYANIFEDEQKSTSYKTRRDEAQAAWDAAGRPDPDAEDDPGLAGLTEVNTSDSGSAPPVPTPSTPTPTPAPAPGPSPPAGAAGSAAGGATGGGDSG